MTYRVQSLMYYNFNSCACIHFYTIDTLVFSVLQGSKLLFMRHRFKVMYCVRKYIINTWINNAESLILNPCQDLSWTEWLILEQATIQYLTHSILVLHKERPTDNLKYNNLLYETKHYVYNLQILSSYFIPDIVI